MHSALRVTALFVHPLKSAAHMRIAEARIDALGFAGDRRWMAVDANGSFLSQRRVPRMCLIRATSLAEGDLYLSAPGVASLHVRSPAVAERTGADTSAESVPLLDHVEDVTRATSPTRVDDAQVVIWGDTVQALDAGDEAAEWISRVLGGQARLVYCPASRARTVDRAFASGTELVGFADGFPLLILGESSLQEINARLRERGEREVGLERFRPNIVIEGGAPFEEDRWRQIIISDDEAAITIDIVKPCARCSIISVDSLTGVQGVEPMRTLATFRRREGDVFVGQNALARGAGRIVTGAPVRVAEWRA